MYSNLEGYRKKVNFIQILAAPLVLILPLIISKANLEFLKYIFFILLRRFLERSYD